METAILVFFIILSVAIAPIALFASFFLLIILLGIINSIIEWVKFKIMGDRYFMNFDEYKPEKEKVHRIGNGRKIEIEYEEDNRG